MKDKFVLEVSVRPLTRGREYFTLHDSDVTNTQLSGTSRRTSPHAVRPPTLKMEAVVFSLTSVFIYQTKWSHIREDCNH
jgi:hypothetical protein